MGSFVLAIVRRQSWHKLFFNLSLFAAEIAVGAAVFSRDPCVDRSRHSGRVAAAFIALLTASALDFASVTVAISIYSGWPGRRLVAQVVLFGGLSCLANTATGLALAISIWDRTYSGILICAVAGALYALYRAYMGLTERHKNLETLHDFTRSLGDAVEISDLEEAVARGRGRSCAVSMWRCCCRPFGTVCRPAACSIRGEDVLRANVSPAQLSFGPQHAAPPQRGPAVRPR